MCDSIRGWVACCVTLKRGSVALGEVARLKDTNIGSYLINS